jgi:hypothetical protein
MAEVLEYLASSGNIPGLPGNHGPGWYLIDYEERTIRPKPIEVVDTPPAPEVPSESHPSASGEQSEAQEESVAPADESASDNAETTQPEQA